MTMTLMHLIVTGVIIPITMLVLAILGIAYRREKFGPGIWLMLAFVLYVVVETLYVNFAK